MYNTKINDFPVWKIVASHQAAMISISSDKRLSNEEYKHILKQYLLQLFHVSVELLPSKM
ncbi:hypothetical protein L3081_09605 [Colwellia sp. MSW7]|uniref:Uncharacterized protein n=1 Tax=Colwellia maritima TaxID=2912588 RepID=A0ABS9X2B2_9GAMM|nr:hypothetical protein [Colwellia maritima]MCI2283601.1 hypothetical protein [Colwellia maritima]